ncbi:hypothetical protein [Gluconobacter thailandicus]|uniref:Uncharacterized protein n=1 Tax=Gluconobacter thailandicus TaxID=257438 RepID=A0AAP9JIY4_GLUTH|nr:hypothetical protein [Gluconobacter thailandicus]QEH97306.1 hypothetical protein FXF46_14390 [Gluconobacter thailandicus]
MKSAENSQKEHDFPCTELAPCTTIPAMETRENPPETDVWPHCVDTSTHNLLPAIDCDAACARLRARQVRDMAVRASRIDDERGVEVVMIDDMANAPAGFERASPSMFDNRGTINTEGDLGLSGE